MMAWWWTIAEKIQQGNRITEGIKDDQYTDDEVRRANVYTREDLVLVVSLLGSLNKQIATVKIILAVIAASVVCIFIRLLFL